MKPKRRVEFSLTSVASFLAFACPFAAVIATKDATSKIRNDYVGTTPPGDPWIVPTLFFGTAFLLCIAIIVSEWRFNARLRRIEERAEPRQGTVRSAESESMTARSAYGPNSTWYHPRITAAYEGPDGLRNVTSTFPGDTDIVFEGKDVEAFLEEYQSGTETTVYVPLDSPDRAFVEPRPDYSGKWAHTKGAVLVLGMTLITAFGAVTQSPEVWTT